MERISNAFKKACAQFKADLKTASRIGSMVAGLRQFFREPVTVEKAKEEIKSALEHREARFLALARAHIYDKANSPYLKLFRQAGCDRSDLENLVRAHGLEKSLAKLAAEGVYFTSDEFKGKVAVVRGGSTFSVSPQDFELSDTSPGFTIQSSGTANHPLRSQSSLEYLSLRAFITAVFFSAHNLFSYSHAMYDAILPGAGGVNNLLLYAKLGVPVKRWFAREIPVNNWFERQYLYWTTRLIVQTGKWFGPGFPDPEFLQIKDINRILQWVSDENKTGNPCCITTVASNAARIAQAAWDTGVSLKGTKFVMSGEPFTETKRALLERVGASGTSRYAYGAGAAVGFGCANPVFDDDVHVDLTRVALISHPISLSDEIPAVHPLLLTSLHPSATSRLYVNVENGDYATLEVRDCHCALGEAGFNLHVQRIRSFEKFTSEGMNYFYGDLFELFERVLPGEFGGGPGHYQLVEEEDSHGQTRLTLVVHPAVGELDEAKALECLREALAAGSRGNRFMTSVWQNAETFRIARKAPYESGRGKILPLHKVRIEENQRSSLVGT